jgi:molecular chaperone GrpE
MAADAGREEEEAPSSGPEPAQPPPGAAPPTAPPAPTPPEEDWAVRYRYLLAEFDNYRRRTDRERERIGRENRALVVRELLPFNDAIEKANLAGRQLPPDHPLRLGFELLLREWDRFLATERFEPVARVGEPFRADEQEAIGEVPATPERPDGIVAEIVQQGYRCAGGLLRPAKVFVARRASGRSRDAPHVPPEDEAGGG